ncbi:AAA family ATPase [Microvirga massiliensis]|uniref:AAA family ATPase n=1 Tax=Microvirga massiliensis TaxID=1033741 RepID=UPI00062BDE00|nr:AAA family ATPase [Microvirga massiliensis]
MNDLAAGHHLETVLARATAALGRAEMRRDELLRRRRDLTAAIELAKGRLTLKDEVETFIEAVHQETSRRNLGRLEALLSALVQEVLPGEKPVALELSTERGLATLDVCARRPDGSLEDVLEDNGGALTNVVGMALRLIAVVKADVGRFLALDEADCWIAPDRVPAFYGVLEDGAARLGVQCLAVSHHDPLAFGAATRISTVVGDAATGVTISCASPDPVWDDALPGLRYIRLQNVQAYRDATLKLSPGVNALIGPNNRGKSTLIRALRAVFYGEARDSLVRAGEKSATIEIGLAGGRVLRFSRQPRRNPVNLWSLHEADGSVVEENGLRHETGGRAVPGWVESLSRITRVEGLDVHVAHQKFPVFLLGEPASRRSAVLSIGQEAAYIRDMLQIHRERCARDAALVRTGERELGEISEDLKPLEGLGDIAARLAEARELASDIRMEEISLQRLNIHVARLGKVASGLARIRDRRHALERLPPSDELDGIRSGAQRSQDLARIAERVCSVHRDAARLRARRAILAGLPASAPLLEDASSAARASSRLATLSSAVAGARQRVQNLRQEVQPSLAAIDAVITAQGGLCPTCGSHVTAADLVDSRGHDHEEKAA